MKTSSFAVCFSLLAIGVLLLLPEADTMTVEELQAQFETFGPKYIDYRKMENEQAKADALYELYEVVETNKWNTDTKTSFYLGSLDLATFKFGEGFLPKTLFQEPATTKDKVPDELKTKLDNIEAFAKTNYAKHLNKEESKVAYHYELFNGKGVGKKDDPNVLKEYALVMFAIATN